MLFSFLRLLITATLTCVLSYSAAPQTYMIQTVAGGGAPVNVPGTSASLPFNPASVAMDGAGNVFIPDPFDAIVLRLDATTGILTMAAGTEMSGYSGDGGPATSARLSSPTVVALDSAGNLYIGDSNRIRKVTNGTITTVAGNGTQGFSGDNGPAIDAAFYGISGLAADAAGNLYISDWGNQRIRKVAHGTITTVAGTGTASYNGDNIPAIGAQLSYPANLAVDWAGNLYIADPGNYRIRKISNGIISTVAGSGGLLGDNGPATSAELNQPTGVAVDAAGDLFIADTDNNRIRKVMNGVITTIAGSGPSGFYGDGGPATGAYLGYPQGVAVDAAGNVYIADWANQRIREVSNGTIATVAGGGSMNNVPATSTQLNHPTGVAADTAGNLYIADPNAARVRDVSNGTITTVAGGGNQFNNVPAASSYLYVPTGVAVDGAGNLYIADSRMTYIREVSNGVITAVAGFGSSGFSGDNGPATSAQLNSPYAVAVDSAGSVYFSDSGNNRIRKVTKGIITTVAGGGTALGDNGPATSAQLNAPLGVAVDSAGDLYIADSGNHRIREVSHGVITTVAGTGTPGFNGDGPAQGAQLSFPYGVAVDWAGNLYIGDTGNDLVRKVSNGVLTTVAGNGSVGWGGDDGPATSASLDSPQGVAVDSTGKAYFADALNRRVRVLIPSVNYSLGGTYLATASIAPASPASTDVITAAITGWVPNTCYSTPTGSVSVAGQNITVSLSSAAVSGVGCGQVTIPFATSVTLGRLAAGAYTVTYRMILDGGPVESISETLTVELPVGIASAANLPPGFVGGAYSETLSAINGTPPYAWSLALGPLPGGLTLTSAGVISGDPTAAGSFSFTVTVRDADATTATQTFTVTIVTVTGPLTETGAFPQVAAGGGWDTSIWLVNTSATPLPIALVFRGDDGSPLSIPITVTQQGDVQTYTASGVERALNQNTTLVVASGALPSNVEGWAEVISTAPVNGFAVFRYAPEGLTPGPGVATPWEATVPLQAQLSASTMILPFDNTDGFSTGAALGSLSLSQADVTATFYDENGVVLGTPQQIPLAANGHTAFVTNVSMPFTVNQRGIVRFTGAALMGIGLRASPYGTLTTVPVVLQ